MLNVLENKFLGSLKVAQIFHTIESRTSKMETESLWKQNFPKLFSAFSSLLIGTPVHCITFTLKECTFEIIQSMHMQCGFGKSLKPAAPCINAIETLQTRSPKFSLFNWLQQNHNLRSAGSGLVNYLFCITRNASRPSLKHFALTFHSCDFNSLTHFD